MSIIIETHIVCDGCGATYGVDMRHLTGQTHRKEYHNANWIYTGNKDLCPNCRPKRKDGNFIHGYRNGRKRTKK